MDETKLTIRIDRATLERAKEYAREHGTSLTRLVAGHLERVVADERPGDHDRLGDAPVVRRLTGVLPPEASPQDHRDHLERKHG